MQHRVIYFNLVMKPSSTLVITAANLQYTMCKVLTCFTEILHSSSFLVTTLRLQMLHCRPNIGGAKYIVAHPTNILGGPWPTQQRPPWHEHEVGQKPITPSISAKLVNQSFFVILSKFIKIVVARCHIFKKNAQSSMLAGAMPQILPESLQCYPRCDPLAGFKGAYF